MPPSKPQTILLPPEDKQLEALEEVIAEIRFNSRKLRQYSVHVGLQKIEDTVKEIQRRIIRSGS